MEHTDFLIRLKREVHSWQWEILFSAQLLIEMRLKSLSCFVAQFYHHHDDQSVERDWLAALESRVFKRVCKVIEVYNKVLR